MSAKTPTAPWRKLFRFVAIYGPERTFFKVASRLRSGFALPTLRRPERDVAVIGCGQFAFATIGYFLRSAGKGIAACFDIDRHASDSMAKALAVPRVADDVEELLLTPGLRIVYIASNHASHTPYALLSLKGGLDVFVEKPVAVSQEQLLELERARRRARGRLFAGYNRPFSAAIAGLRKGMPIDPAAGITMQCFVAGHRLGPDHWYRRPEEGTRVCGNIGHWLDLFVHVLSWRSLPDRLDITIASADPAEPDDNLSIAITSDRGDLFSVMLSSRAEPFEGINETIAIQHGETLCKIDDFRSATTWHGSKVERRRFSPKDVGHRRAILQPFDAGAERDWTEIIHSTLLMLHVADMVRSGETRSVFSLRESRARLEHALATS